MRVLRFPALAWFVCGLLLRNVFSRRRLVAPGGPVVSLTTHGRRIRTVFLTVESIAAGRLLPSRMILWLDDPALLAHPPRSLRRLQARGLEIRRSENFGPHTKYFPFVEGEAAFPLPLATADDDLIYPVSWLERLAVAFGEAPEFVNCYRAHRVRLEDGKLARYGKWGRCTDTRPSYLNFATGVSGVIYPPALLAILKAEGRGFRACCPRADDIWLHAIAIRSGFRIRQIQDEFQVYKADVAQLRIEKSQLEGQLTLQT